jgi:hypothetical protein
MIESSDYAMCHCPDCGPRFFDKEFAFVKQISEEVWTKKPDAMIVVYPHYVSGTEVPGFGVRAAKQPFDPRWTLFFTPHSVRLDDALITHARSSLWWDDSPALRRPQDIQRGARRARDAGVTSYVPSLEAYSFVATVAEEGQAWLKGRRPVPLGFGWLAPGDPPYDELPMRVNGLPAGCSIGGQRRTRGFWSVLPTKGRTDPHRCPAEQSHTVRRDRGDAASWID